MLPYGTRPDIEPSDQTSASGASSKHPRSAHQRRLVGIFGILRRFVRRIAAGPSCPSLRALLARGRRPESGTRGGTRALVSRIPHRRGRPHVENSTPCTDAFGRSQHRGCIDRARANQSARHRPVNFRPARHHRKSGGESARRIPGAVSPSNPNAASRPQVPNIGGSPVVTRPNTTGCGSGSAGGRAGC